MAPTSEPRFDLLQVLALGRIGFGLALMAAPSATAIGYLGRESSRPSVRLLSRLFGARDVAVGTFLLLARDDKRALRQALAIGVACDAWDAVAVTSTPGGVPRWSKPLMLGVALSWATLGAVALNEAK
jgi:hypothetical protein